MALPTSGFIPITKVEATALVEVLVANMMSLFLSGCAVVQCITCLRLLFPGDLDERERAKMRSAKKWQLCAIVVPVLFVVTLSDAALKIALMSVYVRDSVVGGLLSLIRFPVLAVPICVLEGVQAAIVQVTWAVRLTFFWNDSTPTFLRYLTIALAVLSGCAQIAFASYAGWTSHKTLIPLWGHGAQKITVVTWYSLGSISDLLLTGSFVAQLARLRTGFRHTDTVVTKWIGHTLSTGLLATMVTIAALIVYLRFPTKSYVVMCTAWLGPTYTNSVLYLLRPLLQARSARSNPTSSAGGVGSSSNVKHSMRSGAPARSQASHVVISTEYTTDVAESPSYYPMSAMPLAGGGRGRPQGTTPDEYEKEELDRRNWI